MAARDKLVSKSELTFVISLSLSRSHTPKRDGDRSVSGVCALFRFRRRRRSSQSSPRVGTLSPLSPLTPLSLTRR